MPKLENWSLGFKDADPYTPPEASVICVTGNVSNHIKFADGTRITSSRIVNFDKAARLITTRNSVYELGVADPSYVAWCHENNYDAFFLQKDIRKIDVKEIIRRIQLGDFVVADGSFDWHEEREAKWELLHSNIRTIFDTRGNEKATKLFDYLVKMSNERTEDGKVYDDISNQLWVVDGYELLIELVRG